MRTYHKLIAAAAVAATATAMAVYPAIADPPGKTVPRPQDITGVGSDTIQNVFNQFSVDYNASRKTRSAPRLYSFDAVNPKTGAVGDTIKEKSGSKNCKNVRPNGSSGGIDASAGGALALNANTRNAAKGGTGFCTDFARSSRAEATGDGNVTFVPFALDAVTYATNAGSNAPADLSTAQLLKIYTCKVTNWKQVGGHNAPIVAQLPQTASGTRKFFLTAINGGAAPATPGPCVNDLKGESATTPPPNGNFPEENEGVDKFLKGPNVIYPYSTADYIAQVFHSAKCIKSSCAAVKGFICHPKKGQNLFGCDVHGKMQLRDINKTSPTVIVKKRTQLNPKFTKLFSRFVFVVVRTKTGHPGNVPGYLQGLFGPTGWLLTNKAAAGDICNYGFGPLPPRKC
jgi:ABC-type phosphate transport system substrate-binding protein